MRRKKHNRRGKKDCESGFNGKGGGRKNGNTDLRKAEVATREWRVEGGRMEGNSGGKKS